MKLLDAEHWSSDALAGLDWGEGAPPEAPVPQQVLVVVAGQSRVLARCALWWRDTPMLDLQAVGLIGQFWSRDGEASRLLLTEAAAWLAGRGRSLVVGPMDGNTWHAHRLVTWSDGSAPFPLEPQQPAEWVAHWQSAGFAPALHYHSALATPGAGDDPRSERVWRRLRPQGLRLRPLDTDHFEQDLAAIHRLSLQSFRHNLLYQPQSWEDFRQQYLPLKSVHEPAATVLAEDDSGLAGFLFAYPAPGQQAPRLVLKTIAVRPGRDCAGLGLLLADHAYRAAREGGYERVIHALMQDGNRSAVMRADGARVFRRYALLARRWADSAGSDAASGERA